MTTIALLNSISQTMKKLSFIVILSIFCINSIAQETGQFTDARDGKTYKTVKIANQVWMADNLNFEAKECWCYNKDSINCRLYGRLYKWETAKNVCPMGWHLPSEKEFEYLLKSTGGIGNAAYYALIDGGNSGFSALFGGSMYGPLKSFGIDLFAEFWSSTPQIGGHALGLYVSCIEPAAKFVNSQPAACFSIRCLKNN
jgi:uncharacterized protein (TIGR02145 family)